MSAINKIKNEVRIDINKIEEVLKNGDFGQKRLIHMEMDGKYQNKIASWGMSQYGWREKYGFVYNSIGIDAVEHNLTSMKSKLEGYLQDLAFINLTPQIKQSDKITINNTNENANHNKNNVIINNNIDFKDIEKNLSENETMTAEETKNALKILKDLESIYNSNESRKIKWEKTKKVLIWLADKSVDIAISYFPIITNILK